MFKTILNTNESLERLTLSAFDISMLALILQLISLILLFLFYDIKWSTKKIDDKMMHMLHTDHDKEHHDPWHNMPHLLFSVCMFAGHFNVIK